MQKRKYQNPINQVYSKNGRKSKTMMEKRKSYFRKIGLELRSP